LLGWNISEEQAERYVKDVIGTEGIDDEDEWTEAIGEDDGKNGIYHHGEEDEYFIGYMIAEASSDSQFNGKSVDLVKALEIAKKFGEKIGLKDPKIFVGTYAT
jgi:hypothetical protein